MDVLLANTSSPLQFRGEQTNRFSNIVSELDQVNSANFFIHVPIFDMKVLAIKQKNNREGKGGKYLVSRGEKDRRRKGGRDFGEEKFLIS